jgi:transcriptional regulator with XRE-family HTH domain
LERDKKSLGQKLRLIREERRITGPELAQRLGYSQSGISKIENGHLKPSVEYVRSFCRVLSLPKSEREELIELAYLFLLEYSKWQSATPGTIARFQRIVERRESRARGIRDFQSLLVTGLLQTEEYATALFMLLGEQDEGALAKAVRLRLRRQSVLKEKTKLFKLVLSEQCLRNIIGNKRIMDAQLRRILELVQTHDNLHVKILPIDTRVGGVAINSFTLFDEKLVTVETVSMELSLWSDTEVAQYMSLFQALDQASLGGEEMVRFLRQFIGR